MPNEDNTVDQHPNLNKWWKHRRSAMYISLAACIIQTVVFCVVGYYKPESILALGGVVGWSYSFYIFVVGSYFGNTIVEDYVRNKK